MKEVKLTHEQKTMMEIARVGFMNDCPFFCYYFYDQLKEVPTLDVPTAATDGRRLYYNPEYMLTLRPPERVFVLAHEVYHAVNQHPRRFLHYRREDNLRGLPFDKDFANQVADYTINADLIETDVGQINPAWLFRPDVKGADLAEEVYERLFKKNQGGQGGQGQGPGSSFGQHDPRARGKPDPKAQANGGGFDQVLDPGVDPVTGQEDLPDPSEFRESIARAAAAAKAMGKMPAAFQRLVDEILEPQVSWREHIRMLVTGKVGSRSETWDRPNRRRLALSALAQSRNPSSPLVIMPGRRGYGANVVAVAIDTSGSIYGDPKALSAFFGEIGGILADVKPRRVVLIHCDAAVQRVDEATSFDELEHIRAQGVAGGGGTSFIPPFEWLEEHQIRPDALIYLTDMMGSFPDCEPGYPVIWAATMDHTPPPFGEVVRIKT